MKLKIKLISDLCCHSGETYNSYIDSDVVYDEYGFPYIPAKRLKGCIREACLELVEFGIVSNDEYNKLFGLSGDKKSLFTLDNAYPVNYRAMIDDIIKANDQVLTHPQKVLKLFTYTRSQTAMKDGIAMENSLRTMRVVKKDTEFEAELNFDSSVSIEETKQFKLAVSMVKHIGIARTRGLGQVEISVDEKSSCEKKNYRKITAKKSADDLVKLNYSIILNSAVICKSEVGNETLTQEYISGNKVLGIIISHLGTDVYNSLGKNCRLSVSSAYIVHNNERCTPVSKSIQKVKDTNFAISENGDNTVLSLPVFDLLWNYTGDEQLTPLGRYFADRSCFVESVDTQISYHHRRPNDKSIGRANGMDDSTFYQLNSLSRGQKFKGFIIADYETALKLVKAVPEKCNTRIGYAKGTEYGDVSFAWEEFEDYGKWRKDCRKEFAIKLNAPLIMYNNAACPTTDTSVLEKYVSKALNGAKVKFKRMYAAYTTIGGYNVTWNAPKPMFTVFDSGSVFYFECDNTDVSGLGNSFIGERTREGFGEIELYENRSLSLNYKKSRAINNKNKAEQKLFTTELIDKLVRQDELARLKETGRSLAKPVAEKVKTIREIDAVIGKLILIYRGEKNIEDMSEQIRGIEKDSKRKLAENIMQPLKTFIGNPDNYQVTDTEAYQIMTAAYLGQIKYMVRPGRNERRS